MPRPKPKLRGIPHLFGALIALPATYLLVQAAKPGILTNAASIYGASLFCLLACSATYHTPYWAKPIRARLRVIDHSMIYVLIAGCYVPFLTALDSHAPNGIGALVLAGTILGICQTLFWSNAPRAMRTIAYVVLGSLAIFIMPAIYTHLGPDILWLLLGGGVCYIVGAVVYARRYPNPNPLVFGYHEIFHSLVNAAATLHFIAMWKILT